MSAKLGAYFVVFLKPGTVCHLHSGLRSEIYSENVPFIIVGVSHSPFMIITYGLYDREAEACPSIRGYSTAKSPEDGGGIQGCIGRGPIAYLKNCISQAQFNLSSSIAVMPDGICYKIIYQAFQQVTT